MCAFSHCQAWWHCKHGITLLTRTFHLWQLPLPARVVNRVLWEVNRVLWEHRPRQLTAEDQPVDLRCSIPASSAVQKLTCLVVPYTTPTLALSLRQKSFNRLKVFPLRSEAVSVSHPSPCEGRRRVSGAHPASQTLTCLDILGVNVGCRV